MITLRQSAVMPHNKWKGKKLYSGKRHGTLLFYNSRYVFKYMLMKGK